MTGSAHKSRPRFLSSLRIAAEERDVQDPGTVLRTPPGLSTGSLPLTRPRVAMGFRSWTSLSSVLPGQEAGFVGKNGNMDPESLFRKNIFNIFGPFHQAQRSAVDVVVKTDVERL